MNGPARSNPFVNFTSPVQQPLSSWRSPINMKMLSDTIFSVKCSFAGIHNDCNTYPFQIITFHWHPYYKVSAWHISAAVLEGFNSSSHKLPQLVSAFTSTNWEGSPKGWTLEWEWIIHGMRYLACLFLNFSAIQYSLGNLDHSD